MARYSRCSGTEQYNFKVQVKMYSRTVQQNPNLDFLKNLLSEILWVVRMILFHYTIPRFVLIFRNSTFQNSMIFLLFYEWNNTNPVNQIQNRNIFLEFQISSLFHRLQNYNRHRIQNGNSRIAGFSSGIRDKKNLSKILELRK